MSITMEQTKSSARESAGNEGWFPGWPGSPPGGGGWSWWPGWSLCWRPRRSRWV